jgi:carbon storage regulator CsrA
MLVLSRREHESVAFPNLGITVSVVRVAGKVVRLGIEAPKHVRILRHELAHTVDEPPLQPPVEPRGAPLDLTRETRHAVRNRLNTASLGLQVLQMHLEQGSTDDSEALIFQLFNQLHEIDALLDDSQRRDGKGASVTQPHRALIVEDNRNEAQLLAECLRMNGYQVQILEDGRRAIDYLRSHDLPDVVLLDMTMPVMDGPETIHCIRNEPALRGLRLFGVSGADREHLGIETGSQGVDRWFSKPVDVRSLVRALNRELEHAPVRA